MDLSPPEYQLSFSQIEDLQLAASKLRGAKRRSFQAEMALKYCVGSARLAETVFGWGRNNVELGMAEKRTGITCIGAQVAFGGNKSWEERYPAAASLGEIAEAHAQQDPSFLTTIAYTRLTAAAAIEQLRSLGYLEEQVPAPSTMALILNRMGYRLRPVIKAKPQKKSQKQMLSSTTFKPMTSKQTAIALNAVAWIVKPQSTSVISLVGAKPEETTALATMILAPGKSIFPVAL